MIYEISDSNGKDIYSDGMEETHKMNTIVWTPELDKQLFKDFNEFVVIPGNLGGLIKLCQKYNCTLGGMTGRLNEVSRRTQIEFETRWAEFKALHPPKGRSYIAERKALSLDETAVQLV